MSSMKDSLQTLNVYYCGVSVQKMKEMLSTHGMANAQVNLKLFIYDGKIKYRNDIDLN